MWDGAWHPLLSSEAREDIADRRRERTRTWEEFYASQLLRPEVQDERDCIGVAALPAEPLVDPPFLFWWVGLQAIAPGPWTYT